MSRCRYLPGISPAQPGLKIAFQRANLLSQFPDAFQPYLHFGVTLQQPLKGTLFRFPLRCECCAAWLLLPWLSLLRKLWLVPYTPYRQAYDS